MQFRFPIACLVAVLVAGCAGVRPASPFVPSSQEARAAASAAPAQITIPFTDPTADFYVNVSAGGGPFKRVVFDTGSNGMHIIASFAGPKIKRTKTTFSYAYASGTIYSGVIGYGPVSLGPISTSTSTPVGLIETISCVSTNPKCPGASGIAGAIKANRNGVMGVRFSGLAGGEPVDSPLNYLPTPYQKGFVVTRDSLHLGLPQNVRDSFRTVPLAQLPGRNGSGVKAWENSIPMSWTVGGKLLTGTTLRTIFDTGTQEYIMSVPKGTFASKKVVNGLLVSGLSANVSLPNVVAFGFTTGSTGGVNQVAVYASSSKTLPFVNTGWSPFDSYDVLYDPIQGLMGFRPHQ